MADEKVEAKVEEIQEAEKAVGSGHAALEDKSKIYLQLIASFVVNITLISCGLAVSWATVSLPQLQDSKSDIRVTPAQGGWIAGALPIGGCLGPIASALLLNNIGRKWFLYLTTVPFLLCWILTYLAKSWIYLFTARLAAGVSMGALFTMVPVYLGELMENRIRGASGAMMSLSLNLGSILMYGIGPMLSRKVLALICLGPSIVFLLTAPWIPESPYYFLKKGKEKCATIALVWLRRKRNNDDEINEMKQLIEEERNGSFKELFVVAAHRKALFLLLLLLLGQQASGFQAIVSYCLFLLHDMKLPLNDTNSLLVIHGLSFVSGILSSYAVERLGRKPVFLISAYGNTLCLLVCGAYLLLKTLGMKVDQFSMVPLVALAVYFVFFSFGLSSIPSIISSEIFPISVVNWATMLANICGSLLGVIAIICYQVTTNAWGPHVMFLVFSVIELAVAITATVIMPETSGKSFKEIHGFWKKEKPTAN